MGCSIGKYWHTFRLSRQMVVARLSPGLWGVALSNPFDLSREMNLLKSAGRWGALGGFPVSASSGQTQRLPHFWGQSR